MEERPNLTEAEWGLVLELLRAEQRQLPVEIHHSTRAHVRQELHERRQMIDAIIERLELAHVA
jgi:hypothetical protein